MLRWQKFILHRIHLKPANIGAQTWWEEFEWSELVEPFLEIIWDDVLLVDSALSFSVTLGAVELLPEPIPPRANPVCGCPFNSEDFSRCSLDPGFGSDGSWSPVPWVFWLDLDCDLEVVWWSSTYDHSNPMTDISVSWIALLYRETSIHSLFGERNITCHVCIAHMYVDTYDVSIFWIPVLSYII